MWMLLVYYNLLRKKQKTKDKSVRQWQFIVAHWRQLFVHVSLQPNRALTSWRLLVSSSISKWSSAREQMNNMPYYGVIYCPPFYALRITPNVNHAFKWRVITLTTNNYFPFFLNRKCFSRANLISKSKSNLKT